MQVVSNCVSANAHHAAIVVMVDASGGESALLPPCNSLPLPALEFLAAIINAMRASPAIPENETALSAVADLAVCVDTALVRSRRASDASAEPPNGTDHAAVMPSLRDSQACEITRFCGRGIEALAWLRALPPFTSHRVAVHKASGASDLCVEVKHPRPRSFALPVALGALHVVYISFVLLMMLSGELPDHTAFVLLIVLGGSLWSCLCVLLLLAYGATRYAATTEIRIGGEEWSMRERHTMPWWALARLLRMRPVRTVSGKTTHLAGCEVRRCRIVSRRSNPIECSLHCAGDTLLAAGHVPPPCTCTSRAEAGLEPF